MRDFQMLEINGNTHRSLKGVSLIEKRTMKNIMDGLVDRYCKEKEYDKIMEIIQRKGEQ